MASTVLVQARVPVDIKTSADAIFHSMGIDTATGIRLFLAQVKLCNALPFEVKADPFWSDENQKVLRESIAQLESGRGVKHDLIED